MLSVKVKMQTDLAPYPELLARVNKFMNWSSRHRIDYWAHSDGCTCQLFRIDAKNGDWYTVGEATDHSFEWAIKKALDQWDLGREGKASK